MKKINLLGSSSWFSGIEFGQWSQWTTVASYYTLSYSWRNSYVPSSTIHIAGSFVPYFPTTQRWVFSKDRGVVSHIFSVTNLSHFRPSNVLYTLRYIAAILSQRPWTATRHTAKCHSFLSVFPSIIHSSTQSCRLQRPVPFIHVSYL